MEKLSTQSYQWTNPSPTVTFTAFMDMWPRGIEMEIGAALCATGMGKTLTLIYIYAYINTDGTFQTKRESSAGLPQ